MIKLEALEYIEAAFGEECRGFGWSNYPIKVLISHPGNPSRIEYIQPKDQDDTMRALFKVSAVVTGQLRSHVDWWIRGGGK